MTPATVLIELAEKMSLLAAAALVAVLFPPLRDRVLGVGRPRDEAAAVVLGLAMSIWGASASVSVLGESMNFRAIGVLIAAILGGLKAGALAGLGGGLYYAALVDEATAPWVLFASIADGVIAGLVAERAPRYFHGARAFVTASAIQSVHVGLVALGLVLVGHADRYVPAWPAHIAKVLINAAGLTLFVTVARVVVAREENAVALATARAAADAAALEALRRRLEPHFLFNALNTLRATIRRDPTRARELVSDLADLYRYLLSHPEDATLREEIEHACAYLAIERARLGDALLVEVAVDDACAAQRIPALLLQPLVENAVGHGVSSRDGPGKVRISARREEGELMIEVEDFPSGEPRTLARSGTGTALATLRSRLSTKYAGRASIELVSSEPGTRAVVRIPWDGVADWSPSATETAR